jgi:L-aspartate oxidase
VLEGGDSHGVIPGRRLAGRAGPTAPIPDAVGDVGLLRDHLQRAMTRGAGVLRDARSLTETARVAQSTLVAVDRLRGGVEREELRNLATVASAMLDAATARTESRGCHTRSDFPSLDPSLKLRFVM